MTTKLEQSETLLNEVLTRKAQWETEAARLEAEEKSRATLAELTSDWTNNTIVVTGGIDTTLAEYFNSRLRQLHRLRPGNVTLVLNSPGGEIVAGLSMLDQLEELKSTGTAVTIKVRGEACSMAGVLLQGASPGRRYVGRQSKVMIHNGGLGAWGATHEVEDRVEYMNQLLAQIAAIFADANTRDKDAAFFLSLFKQRKDIYYTAQEAVDLGLADIIG